MHYPVWSFSLRVGRPVPVDDSATRTTCARSNVRRWMDSITKRGIQNTSLTKVANRSPTFDGGNEEAPEAELEGGAENDPDSRVLACDVERPLGDAGHFDSVAGFT